MKEITSSEEFFTLARSERPTVMIFSAGWCPDCRFLDGFIDDVVTAYGEKMNFYKVNRDEFPEICDMLEILGIPSFIVYHQGAVVGRFVSKLRKTRAEVEGFLDDVLAKVQTNHPQQQP